MQGCRGCTEDVRTLAGYSSQTDPAFHSTQSTLTNKSRLKLLQQREEHLQDLFFTARTLIFELSRDEARYVQFLEGVIVQGFLQLLEPNVTVHARETDVEIVQRAVDGAAKQYTEVSGRTVNAVVKGTLSNDMYVCSRDSLSCVSKQLLCSAGGVKLISGSQRITLDNTLDERLRLLEDRVFICHVSVVCR